MCRRPNTDDNNNDDGWLAGDLRLDEQKCTFRANESQRQRRQRQWIKNAKIKGEKKKMRQTTFLYYKFTSCLLLSA